MWTRGEDKLVELMLARSSPRWDVVAVARLLDNKTPEQVSQRFERMVDQVTHLLHALEVDTPREWDDTPTAVAAPPAAESDAAAAVVPTTVAAADVTTTVASSSAGDVTTTMASSAAGEAGAIAEEKALVATTMASSSAGESAAVVEERAVVATPSSAADGEPSEPVANKKRKRRGDRKKPENWTQEEHRLFLLALEIYGKGNWKAMSKEILTTKTASQIASHHQKYCKRLEQRKRNGCKRASIHDITELTDDERCCCWQGR